jgi:hypothetical protein
MTTICFYSSFIFLTNSLFAFLKQKYVYSLAFYTLAVTSAVVHGIYYSFETMILDKLAIFSLFAVGANYFFSNYTQLSPGYLLCIISTFLMVVFIYFYGCLMKRFCYDEDKTIAYFYHSILHIIGSISHHMIIYSL